jgi:hypothetical protein
MGCRLMFRFCTDSLGASYSNIANTFPFIAFGIMMLGGEDAICLLL